MIQDYNTEKYNGLEKTGSMMVEFYSKKCGPCKMLSFVLRDIDKIFPDFRIKPAPGTECKSFEMRDEAYDDTSLTCYKYGYLEGGLKKIESERDKYGFYKKIECLQAYHDTPTKDVLEFVLTGGKYADAEGIILFSDGQPDSLRKKRMSKKSLLKYIR